MKQRVVEPEILETLAEDDPAAVRGRRDLRIVNSVMGNYRWMLAALRRYYRPGWRITELGAGDGALSLRVARAGICREEDLHGLDLVGRPPHWPTAARWTQGNLLEAPLPESEVLICNLLLHHFKEPELRCLGERIPAATKLILTIDPARSPVHTVLGKALGLLAGFHAITHHDMQVSIRGGFRGDELPRALGLAAEWRCMRDVNPLAAYRLVAMRG